MGCHRSCPMPVAAMSAAAIASFLAVALTPLRPAHALAYDVGPGLAFEAIGDVPWESLMPGDEVLIHWREAPYAEKFVICRQGTESNPIVVRGISGPLGELPVIDGRDATTRSSLDFWSETRGVIKIGGANAPDDTMPSWIVIENLEIRSGRAPFTFTGRDGLTGYDENAASIFVEKGEHIRLSNLALHDSGNGLFVAHETTDILVEGCHVHDNGIEGSIYEHNSYTEANGIVFQFNHYGPLRAGCLGNNLKDRSAGTVVRYNWIESGNRQLDLVESDHDSLISLPSYRVTFVYGNVLVEHEGDGNSQILHYGGDNGDDESIYRKGTLYFFNNTVVSTRDGNTTLARLSTNDEHADCRNNVIYVTAPGDRLAMLAESGALDLANNWTKPGWVDCHGTLAGTITDHGGSVTGDSPGFANEAAQDFHLAHPGSLCLDAGTDLAAAALPDHAPLSQYVVHQGAEPRPLEGPLDLGAFETCQSGDCAGAGDDVLEPVSDLPPEPGLDTSTDPGIDSPDAALDTPADLIADPGIDTSPDDPDRVSGCGCSFVS